MPTPTIATYAFLPWLRRGMAAHIKRRDGETSADIHVRVPVGLTLNTNLPITVPLALRGPGEVGLLNRDVIARRYPAPNSFDVESNYFPLIEFEQPDLPWRYTPAREDTADRLRPWLCLVTLADDEVTDFTEAGGDGLPGVITVGSALALPNLDQIWAWAHVQVTGEDAQDLDAATLNAVLSAHPERVIARLLSPRRLVPNSMYHVFLVPTFERGRRAALGEQPQGDALAPAWTSESADIRLPVFDHWRFGTGPTGDFEYLARQLQARPLPAGVGTRPIDVTTAGLGLPPAADGPMLLEGALVPPQFTRPAWSGATATAFRAALTSLLEMPAVRLSQANRPRIVGPPLYGKWHARRELLAPQPPWFGTLNLDPRNRVLAGAGTHVVQNAQRALMASAWQQVAGVREANERLRFAQLARVAAERIFVRHVTTHETDVMLGVTAPLHAKVMASPTTVAERLRTSPVAPGALAPQLRRVSRPSGPLGRRLGFAARGQPPRIVDRLNRADLLLAPAPETPAGAITPSAAVVKSAGDTPERRASLRRRAWTLRVVALILLILALVAIGGGGVPVGFVAALVLAALAAAAYAAARAAKRRLEQFNRLDAFAAGALTAEDIASAPSPAEFIATESAPAGGGGTTPPPPASGGSEQASAARFREAAAAVLGDLSTPAVEPPPLTSARLDDMRATLSTRLRPETTFAASFQGRLKLPPGVARQPGPDPLESVMAAPQFAQAMYRPLAELSQDWLLPGLDLVPQNTTTLLETNQTVVESYLVGLSHEMARELQWNEYPTDKRGTYFRQFWDVAGYAGNVPPEKLRDIKEIHTWRTTGLGANSARDLPPSGKHLVLLVRGELLRRYPNTIVYVAKTVHGASGREPGTDERHPLFRGALEPDVTFFGFDLTVDEVRGVDDPASPNQGWYFVFQEQPAEPRFGLDVATGAGGVALAWSDLSWGHLAATEEELQAVVYIDLDTELPDTRQIAETGGAAWHASAGQGPAGATAAHLAHITIQQPMRVALHGSDMIRAS
jgi:hypothetical protein